MSTIIMSACWTMQGMSPAQKAVLVSLADQANDDGVCWPSVKHIAMRTCLSERSVQSAIKWLVSAGALSVQERNGRSTVYIVTPATFAPPQEMHPAPVAPTPANNVVTPATFAPAPANAAPITVKNHKGTVKEPSIPPAERVESYSVADLVAFGVDDQVAAEFLALRRRKRSPLTPLALDGIRREAIKAEMTLDGALRRCVERGWQGFDAAWVLQTTRGLPALNRQEALEARNQAVVDEMMRGAI